MRWCSVRRGSGAWSYSCKLQSKYANITQCIVVWLKLPMYMHIRRYMYISYQDLHGNRYCGNS